MLHSEFGRMPISQLGVGRDHNPGAVTVFMCGAAIGTTDDVGLNAEEQPTSNHDIHGSILHLMGMDRKKLTYYFNGRNRRLTDVEHEWFRRSVERLRRRGI